MQQEEMISGRVKYGMDFNNGPPQTIVSVVKTVYNWTAKSVEQREEILILETDEYLRNNPQYEYISYSTKNGKHGEHIVTFYFKRKQTN